MERAKRVLVTRSTEQSSDLADCLKDLGMEPQLIAALEIAPPNSFEVLDTSLRRLQSFDWILFTSANAVRVFAERLPLLRGVGDSSAFPAGLKLAAIGKPTAEALRTRGFAVALVPSAAVAESLLSELLPHVRPLDGRATRFLLVRAQEAREFLPQALRAAGAEVVVAPAYRTQVPAGSVAAVRTMFGNPDLWPHVVTFTSSSSVHNLLELLRRAELELPAGIRRVSIGPITSQTLKDAGLPAHRQAREATVRALAEACLQV
jgi:uroporphyrinogen-III synthase